LIAYSKQLAKLFNCQSGILNQPAHCVGVDGIVAGYRYSVNSIRHDYVLALARNVKPGFFEHPNSVLVIYAWELRHLCRHLDLSNLGALKVLFND